MGSFTAFRKSVRWSLQPELVTVAEKKLVGVYQSMSFAAFDPAALWSKLMPRRKEIKNFVTSELVSLAIYSPGFFASIQPQRLFEKWAAVEVLNFDHVPPGLETFLLPSGLYAVFHYQGRSGDPSVFEFIFGTWLPRSPYQLDDRPHFEVLGEKYKNQDPLSEEEIYIPVQLK